MERPALAALLTDTDPTERADLLGRHLALADIALAQELRSIYFGSYSSHPQRAAEAARALTLLADTTADPETRALAVWVEGLAALQLEGQVERAVEHIDEAAARFTALGQTHAAATTQVSKVFALARLGRYQEAVACGLGAREALLAHGDILAAGRVELNLGNLAHQRGQYAEAAGYYHAARERFAAAGDQQMLTFVLNGLANVLSQQHQFRAAAELYEQALTLAEAAGHEVTRAEVECNLGVLALFQGRYDQALAYLERSRRRYAALGMAHESAIADLELADAYLELNLVAEAAAIYAQVLPIFAGLGLWAEQARALLNYGRANLQLGHVDDAWMLFAEARALFTAEGGAVGAAMVDLVEAGLHFRERDYLAVAEAAARAEPALSEVGAWGQLLSLRWLSGEAARLLGQPDVARRRLEQALAEARERGVSQIEQRCHTSLGCLAAQVGDRATAEAAFQRAAALIETMRAPLPADELRTALAAEATTAYAELVRLCLDDPAGGREAEALGYAERGRARALIEMLGGAVRLPESSHAGGDPADQARLAELRAELNWLYSRINRPPDGDGGMAALASLYEAARERELAMAELRRRLRHSASGSLIFVEPLDLPGLQADLGAATALVEYVELGEQLVAFVVTDRGVEVVRGLGPPAAVEVELERLRFQIGALGHGAAAMRSHLAILAGRARHHLRALYDQLLRPIEPLLGARRLIVVPHRALHYVPFHALHDGTGHLIERREVCYAPSAEALRRSLALPRAAPSRALILGVSDEQAPHAREEAAALAPRFPAAETLLDQAATAAALASAAPSADVIHLACHGTFRPDNPLFSALHLADGWLTVHDVYTLDLRCQLVTLSACETGVSLVAPGDELLGMARGFFLAGAPALLVSLWAVDDEATAELMADFYARLCAGDLPSAALRRAQLAAMQRRPHPFFWASFILFGRW